MGSGLVAAALGEPLTAEWAACAPVEEGIGGAWGVAGRGGEG